MFALSFVSIRAWPLLLTTLTAAMACTRDTTPVGALGEARRCHDRQCLIEAGMFTMGSPQDEPYRGRYTEEQRNVTLTRSFLMGQYEVTQEEWKHFDYPNPSASKNGGTSGDSCMTANCPVTVVTWFDAVSYANRLSREAGLEECVELSDCSGAVGDDLFCRTYRQTTPSYYDCTGYRLPTHVEFQYALRAGTTTTFYSGQLEPARDDCFDLIHLTQTAWYCHNSRGITHEVGLLKPNPWGLYDMLGNVAEFLATPMDRDTTSMGDMIDPGHQLDTEGNVSFGGGAILYSPYTLRSAGQADNLHMYVGDDLEHDDTSRRAMGIGFRLVRSLTAEQAAAW